MEKAVETSYGLKSCSGPPGTHRFYLRGRGVVWALAFLAFLAHYRLTEEPSAKTLNVPIHLGNMRAEMCSAFNSSINQLLSSTNE